MSALAAPFTFANGSTIKNRYMLAALTNLQSGADGVLVMTSTTGSPVGPRVGLG